MKLSVPNVQAFISDPKVATAIGKGIAEAIKVDASWVVAKLSAGRRLDSQTEGHMRRLQGGTVVVTYTITVPPGAAVTPTAIEKTLSKSDAAAVLTADINKEMEKAGFTGAAYTVKVDSVTAPTVVSSPTTTAAREQQTSGASTPVQHTLAIAVLLFATFRRA